MGNRNGPIEASQKVMKRTKAAHRRTVLKTIGVGGAFILGSGTTAARGHGGGPKPSNHTIVKGEEFEVGKGSVMTYATKNPAGNLSSLGVHLDGDAFSFYDTEWEQLSESEKEEEMLEAHLSFPDEVDTHQFTFSGFHYNPTGHPPPGIYTVPHFDFHFYFIEETTVENIPFGIAAYDIPDEQMPPDYIFGDPRVIEPVMGEHLLDSTAPEVINQDQSLFTHTNIYGVYDPDIDPGEPDDTVEIPPFGEVPVYGGDGTGRLTFVEPMITNDFIRNSLTEEMAVEIATPDVFPVADAYPTQYVMKPDGDGGVFVFIDGFEEFPGPNS